VSKIRGAFEVPRGAPQNPRLAFEIILRFFPKFTGNVTTPFPLTFAPCSLPAAALEIVERLRFDRTLTDLCPSGSCEFLRFALRRVVVPAIFRIVQRNMAIIWLSVSQP